MLYLKKIDDKSCNFAAYASCEKQYFSMDGAAPLEMDAWRATVYHTGLVRWEPQGMVRSSCPINVEFFPFDMQAWSIFRIPY